MFVRVLLVALLPPEQEQWQTITVTAEPQASRVLPPSVEIGEERLLARQPRSAAEALKGIDGVSIRPNSRGESVARVRGAEERQTQVFLDGAPLSVPWDGRVDLGVLPAGLIGTVRVTKGAVPIEYGANAVAGAVDLETRSGGTSDFRAIAEAGSLGFAQAAAVGTARTGAIDWTFAASGLTRDAEPVADLAALPFSQARSDRRTNTDIDTGTLFAAARYAEGPVTLRAYALHVTSRFGIAPESDRDPAVDAPRYWRYPEKDLTQLALSSELKAGGSSARLVAWQQWFDQRIVQYRDATYSTPRAQEKNDDSTLGARIVLSTPLDLLTIRLVGTAQTSRHAQQDRALPAPPGPRLLYRQSLYTLGGEADTPLMGGKLTMGVAYDRSTNPRTGDKPGQPAKDALAFSAAYRLTAGDGFSIAMSGGRRSRFPTARELFGEALGRFLPNPGLMPERAWLADVELTFERPGFGLRVNPFYVRSEDTIAQRVVRVDGRNLRQRYNLSGSESLGVDAGATARLGPRLDWELNASVLRARANRGAAPFRRLTQRPGFEVYTALDWRPIEALSLRGEYRHVGGAVDQAPNGDKARLPAGSEVNLRARWQLTTLGSATPISLTGSVDNLIDDVITPQLGLPLAGRAVRIGVQIN
jgi:iron complex outermembrane receptor protein